MSQVAPYRPAASRQRAARRLCLAGLDPQEAQLRDGMRPGDPGYGEAPGVDPGAYVEFYARVREWARGEGPAPVDPADAVRVLEVLEATRS